MNTIWIEQGSSYWMGESSQQKDNLEPAIYKLQDHPQRGLFLEKICQKFSFAYKIYGINEDFVKRVKKSWDNTTGNFGVLLNGTKGTGKTITAELICNEMNLPVIIIPFKSDHLSNFLNSIQQDVVVFIDEYEKMYDRYNNSLLAIMDGVMKTDNRIMFLLTTNDDSVEGNMLQRPSRIRYVKSYGDLTIDVVMEVVKDTLIYTQFFDDCIKMISELPIITMDLVKSIIQEVNIHEENPYVFKDYFNIHGNKNDLYKLYKINLEGEKEIVGDSVRLNYPNMLEAYENTEFYISNRYIGIVEKYISNNQCLVSSVETDDKGNDKNIVTTYIWEKAYRVHSSFSSYAF